MPPGSGLKPEQGNDVEIVRAAGRLEIKKPSVPKCLGGSQKTLGFSKSSLAVFYVEQVALNRHVSLRTAAVLFMLEKEEVVKRK